MSLPSMINYSLPSSLLDGTQSTSYVLNPTNSKATYGPGDVIIFDLNCASANTFIDPKSIYLSYLAQPTTQTIGGNPAGTGGQILGCPVYSPIYKVDTIINGQIIESVVNYNLVATAWVNLNMNVADKNGNQYGLGYATNTAADNFTLEYYDSRFIAPAAVPGNATDYFVSSPLICNILSGCEKYIPSGMLPSIRIQITLDALANFTNTAAATITAWQAKNFQLTYNAIDFGYSVYQQIMSDPFIIKSTGYCCSSVTIQTGTGGSQSIIFNNRYASIKSAIIYTGGGTTTNGNFDSIDITSGGTYQIQCGGKMFPSLSLNAGVNKAAIIQEIKKCQGLLYNPKNNMSINSIEFSYTDGASVTSNTQPGKFYVALDLTKIGCGSSSNLLNGTSSQNSPITVLLNIARTGGTAAVRNMFLILQYDALLKIDPSTSMLTCSV
jgi:hypothetical protein